MAIIPITTPPHIIVEQQLQSPRGLPPHPIPPPVDELVGCFIIKLRSIGSPFIL
jgi:hypothetical protein